MKIAIIITSLFITSILSAQQIGEGYAPYLTDFTSPLKSGTYGGTNVTGKAPDNSYDWQHLLVIRHGNPENNHQLQIASSFSTNDRLFFRKLAGYLGPLNPDWIEIATRGTNTFNGNQIVNGNVGIGISVPSAYLEILTPVQTQGLIYNTQKWSSGNPGYELKLQTIWNTQGINQEIIQRFNNIDYKSLVFFAGNVGIGISNPNNKLDVNGTIHSKEVKVDMNGWSDFVFKKEYNLPTLVEVEKHIKEKGHLENIPSEDEVLKNGINLGEMNTKLLQKIEELTLYVIAQNKSIEELRQEIKDIKSKK